MSKLWWSVLGARCKTVHYREVDPSVLINCPLKNMQLMFTQVPATGKLYSSAAPDISAPPALPKLTSPQEQTTRKRYSEHVPHDTAAPDRQNAYTEALDDPAAQPFSLLSVLSLTSGDIYKTV